VISNFHINLYRVDVGRPTQAYIPSKPSRWCNHIYMVHTLWVPDTGRQPYRLGTRLANNVSLQALLWLRLHWFNLRTQLLADWCRGINQTDGFNI